MYETIAQVAPVLLLAMVFESRFLRAFELQRFVRFWTVPRVRALGAIVVAAFGLAEGISIFVISDIIESTPWLKWTTIGCTLVLLIVLAGRVSLDIWQATEDQQGDLLQARRREKTRPDD